MDILNAVTRPLVTIALTAALIYLTIIGRVGGEQFFTVVTMVLGFWFGQRVAANGNGKTNGAAPEAPAPPKGE